MVVKKFMSIEIDRYNGNDSHNMRCKCGKFMTFNGTNKIEDSEYDKYECYVCGRIAEVCNMDSEHDVFWTEPVQK